MMKLRKNKQTFCQKFNRKKERKKERKTERKIEKEEYTIKSTGHIRESLVNMNSADEKN